MNKFVCFDIGNVLLHVNFTPFLSIVSKTVNISKDDAYRFLAKTQKLHDLGITDLQSELQDRFNIYSEETIKEIMDCWNKTIRQEYEMFSLLSQLLYNDFQIALLSNIGTEHSSYLKPFFRGYEVIKYFSCEVGARKPSALYYQSFLARYPQFKGAFYVDDIKENLDAGETFGFKPIQFSLDALKGENEDDIRKNIEIAVESLKNIILSDK